MLETIKKTLLAGIGAAVITTEKVQDSLEDYVRQGKIKAEDAKIIAEKIAERGKREFEDLSQQATARAAELFHRNDTAVNARLAALEAGAASAGPIAASTRNNEP